MRYVACALLCSLTNKETTEEDIKRVLESAGVDYKPEKIVEVLEAIQKAGGTYKAIEIGLEKIKEYKEDLTNTRYPFIEYECCGCCEFGCHICEVPESEESDDDSDPDFGFDSFFD